ncbi:hypothetical protein ERJ75_000034600 [Trypanosoma vivax]|uniref:U3 small nucleolar RNA-associated protein 18 n=1 Tax=Trypanosoma vivax (strain Y486) TaxID=1055687 RepID=G0U7S7_TRYVY|nr:hypothetical protein TRVL_00811 [Trypanosoma vivax]KAH8620396.1 hypothetical protein ERJ75_000034600 [Trypanosoma vivax]CCC51935.1 conserved hypothetical protein [Trypanosoma vivax Y486]
MKPRAWVDEADAALESNLPEFERRSHVLPSWARPAKDEAEDGTAVTRLAGEKRFREDDLDALLARTEPLLTSKHDRQQTAAPPVLSVLPLPRDTARSIQWHRNGQLAIVGGNQHIYLFHAAGRFVQQLSKTYVCRRIQHAALGPTGEDVVVVGHEMYTPSLLKLSVGKVVPLNFMYTRDSTAYRNGRRDNSKHDFYINKVAARDGDSTCKAIAVSCGATVMVGSLVSGSITHRIEVSDPVVDFAFSRDSRELTVATRSKLIVYDLRKTAHFLRELQDRGTVDITTFSTFESAVAIGSASGVVSLFSGGGAANGPVKALKNLTTSIGCTAFGQRGDGSAVLAFSTAAQKGGFRLATLPDCRVVPSFPAVGQRHSFIQALAVAPTIPVLSVGERQKVTNYAL